ncbi:MAG: DUF2256 domain-containing protein [Candidatus Taylorbacteria bacterium]|nr:DUF2256 domain-containing protein [Candidatus Taylorbacteria bacterium]
MNKKVETKLCLHCKRPFANRKRWRSRGQWEQVLYCSDACKRKVKKHV